MDNLVALSLQSTGYNVAGDYSHGTYQNAYQHKRMMEEIANEVTQKVIKDVLSQLEPILEEKMKQAYSQAINDFLGAIDYDIESVTRIGFANCKDIFEDKKTQKYISDQIKKTIERNLRQKR
jgi:uncharacterized membrane protein YheB (UPF0754 family)